MADLRTAIVARLGAGSATRGIASSRVTWRKREQGSPMPAVVLNVVSEARPQHLDGFDDMRTARIQADCWAQTLASAVALAEAVIADLVGDAAVGNVAFWRASVEGPRDLGEQTDSEGFLHRESVDLVLRYAVVE
jgi:hypothetical protein